MDTKITYCQNGKCPSKDRCFRYTEIPDTDQPQQYMIYAVPEGEDKCEMFFPLPKELTAEDTFRLAVERYGTPEEFREKYMSGMTDMIGYRPGEEIERMEE